MLRIHSLKKADEGQYECQIPNMEEEVLRHRIKLTVLGRKKVEEMRKVEKAQAVRIGRLTDVQADEEAVKEEKTIIGIESDSEGSDLLSRLIIPATSLLLVSVFLLVLGTLRTILGKETDVVSSRPPSRGGRGSSRNNLQPELGTLKK